MMANTSLPAISAQPQQAWASKVDARGNILWNYFRDLEGEDKPLPIGVHPNYAGAVPMSDGSIYLCGTMTRADEKTSPALLTHLSPDGRLLSEQFIVHSERRLAMFGACVRWNDDVAMIGYSEDSFWIYVIDAGGKKKWDKVISASGKNVNPALTFDSNIVPMIVRGNLTFSATDNTGTEFIAIDQNGKLLAQREFDGRWLFVRSSGTPGNILQAYGSYAPPALGTSPPRFIVSMNEQFVEVGSRQGPVPSNMDTTAVYQLPDRSFALFGSSLHSWGAHLRPAATHVDEALQSEHAVELEDPGYPNEGRIRAVARGLTPGSFVSVDARATTKEVSDPTSFKRGAAMRFFTLGK